MTAVMVTEAVTVVEVAVAVVNLTMTFCRQLVISLQYEDNAREKEIEKDDKRMGTECLRMTFSMFFCGRKLSGKKGAFPCRMLCKDFAYDTASLHKNSESFTTAKETSQCLTEIAFGCDKLNNLKWFSEIIS